MAGFGYVCAVALAGVFVWAAAAKLARPTPTAAGFVALGVPAAPVLVWAVPAAELVAAAALLAAPRVGAVVAIVLLAVFSGVIASAVRRGVVAPCSCFGSASARSVSSADLVRNGLLTVLAAAAILAVEPTSPPVAAVAVAVVVVVVGAGVLRAARRAAS